MSQWHFWHFSFLSNYWTSVIWPDIWHTEINFLYWKVVCSHSFLICLDNVRIKYGFLSLLLLRFAPVFWRSDMWLTDTKREDLDRLIKWTPWYSTSCNSQSQFSTTTIKIALKSGCLSIFQHSDKSWEVELVNNARDEGAPSIILCQKGSKFKYRAVMGRFHTGISDRWINI